MKTQMEQDGLIIEHQMLLYNAIVNTNVTLMLRTLLHCTFTAIQNVIKGPIFV